MGSKKSKHAQDCSDLVEFSDLKRPFGTNSHFSDLDTMNVTSDASNSFYFQLGTRSAKINAYYDHENDNSELVASGLKKSPIKTDSQSTALNLLLPATELIYDLPKPLKPLLHK